MTHSETSITSLIRAHFAGNAYAVLSQVRNATGYSRAVTRTADAIVMSLWPSRGLTLSGFEIKVSKSDWKKELDDPEKAEEISRFCDRWYVAAPTGLVNVADLPPTWGLFEAGEKKLTLAREAQIAKEVQPVTRGFLGALLRAATTGVMPKSEIEDRARERVEELLEVRLDIAVREALPAIQELQRKCALLQKDLERQTNRIAAFEEQSGIRLDEYQAGRIGKAVEAIRWQDHEKTARSMREQAESLERAAARAREAASELDGIERVGEKPVDRLQWGGS
jgi:hypothetical protein